MRVLAIDYGEKRMGLALSDPLGLTAQGLGFIEREGEPSDGDRLREICLKKKIEKCIVGLPLRFSGQAGPKAQEVIQWIHALREKLPCPIETLDERLTTKEANRLMIQQGLSRKKRKLKSDELAAVLILQSYLEKQRPPSS